MKLSGSVSKHNTIWWQSYFVILRDNSSFVMYEWIVAEKRNYQLLKTTSSEIYTIYSNDMENFWQSVLNSKAVIWSLPVNLLPQARTRSLTRAKVNRTPPTNAKDRKQNAIWISQTKSGSKCQLGLLEKQVSNILFLRNHWRIIITASAIGILSHKYLFIGIYVIWS